MEQTGHPRRSWWQVTWRFVGLFCLLQLVQLWLIPLTQPHDSLTVLWLAGYFLSFFGVIYLAWRSYRFVHPDPVQWLNSKDLNTMVLGIVTFFAIEIGLALLNSAIYHQSETANNQAIARIVGSNPVTMWAMGVTAVFCSPIAEELTFRGLFMDGYFKVQRFWLPILLSGAIFSIGHMSTTIISFLIYMAMGSTLAFVYRRTGNIWTDIGMHMVNNLVAMSGMILTLLH